jgi:hypothetical protein
MTKSKLKKVYWVYNNHIIKKIAISANYKNIEDYIRTCAGPVNFSIYAKTKKDCYYKVIDNIYDKIKQVGIQTTWSLGSLLEELRCLRKESQNG